jgi:hypothetical protein
MPINRYSQSRRAHLELKASNKTRNAFNKEANDAGSAPIKEANKKARGAKKKR